MSPQENRAAAEIALWGALLLFIWMRLTDGIVILGQSLGTIIVEQQIATLDAPLFARLTGHPLHTLADSL